MRLEASGVVAVLALAGVVFVAQCGPDGARAEEQPSAPAKPGAAEYVGSARCMHCHFKQHKTWKTGPLGRALQSLRPGRAVGRKKACGLDPKRDYSKDPKCLKCHTTGYGTASGYPAPREKEAPTAEELARAGRHEGVGCEACHGPGSLYVPHKRKHPDYRRADLIRLGATIPAPKTACLGCHTQECPTISKDYVFDFEAMRKRDAIHAHKPLKREH